MDTLERLYRIRATCLKMLMDRGYLMSSVRPGLARRRARMRVSRLLPGTLLPACLADGKPGRTTHAPCRPLARRRS